MEALQVPDPHPPEPARRCSTGKCIAFTLVTLLLFLVLLEGVLRLIPAAVHWHRARDSTVGTGGTTIITLGDSVPFGLRFPPDHAWPMRLECRLHHNGLKNVRVFNRAQPGARSKLVRDVHLRMLDQVPVGSSLITLVQLGHNDAMYWSLNASRALVEKDGRLEEAEVHPRVRSALYQVRLARVLWWSLGSMLAPPDLQPTEAAQLRSLQENLEEIARVGQRKGKIFLVTYLVPGAPGPEVDPELREAIELTRRLQTSTNKLIRMAAARVGVPVIDLPHWLGSAPTYDPATFIDNIHLSARGHAEVARVVDWSLHMHGAFNGP